MARHVDLTGQVIGIWTVLEATDKRAKKGGEVIYKCRCSLDNKIYLKDTQYLRQFKQRGSKSMKGGRPRKATVTIYQLKHPLKK